MTSHILLYVEDEKGDVFFMRHAFEQLGIPATLQIASTGPQALAYLAGTGTFSDRTMYPIPTVVLLDINLPGCSGFDVLKWLREQPDFMHLPVIMFSSSVRPEDLQRARILGATDYIEKPASGLDFSMVAERLWQTWMNGSSAPSSPAQPTGNSSSRQDRADPER